MGVELGAGDPRVAQDGLDVPEVRMVTEHLSGHRVAESMRRYDLANAARLRGPVHDLPDGPNGKPSAAVRVHEESFLFIASGQPGPHRSRVLLSTRVLL